MVIAGLYAGAQVGLPPLSHPGTGELRGPAEHPWVPCSDAGLAHVATSGCRARTFLAAISIPQSRVCRGRLKLESLDDLRGFWQKACHMRSFKDTRVAAAASVTATRGSARVTRSLQRGAASHRVSPRVSASTRSKAGGRGTGAFESPKESSPR